MAGTSPARKDSLPKLLVQSCNRAICLGQVRAALRARARANGGRLRRRNRRAAGYGN